MKELEALEKFKQELPKESADKFQKEFVDKFKAELEMSQGRMLLIWLWRVFLMFLLPWRWYQIHDFLRPWREHRRLGGHLRSGQTGSSKIRPWRSPANKHLGTLLRWFSRAIRPRRVLPSSIQ